MAIVKKRYNILLLLNGVRYVLNRDSRVFIMVKGCAKEENSEIGSHESGIRCHDCSVKE